MDINRINNSVNDDASFLSDIFDESKLLSLLNDISLQEEEMNAALLSEEETLIKSSDSNPNLLDEKQSAWMDSLINDINNSPDIEQKEYIPRDISEFPREIYSDAQLSEIQKGINHRVNIDIYSDVKYSGRQMREIRYGLERNLDVTFYANVYFRERQMKEIRLGLQQGLDVSDYARLIFSASDMKSKREALFHQKYDNNLEALSFDFDDKDTGVHIYVEPGLMEAGIVLKKPLPKSYTKFDLKGLLKEYDIIYGFDEVSLPSNLANLPLQVKIPVMNGKAAVEGADGYYKFDFDIEYEHKPEIREDGSVSYFTPKNYKTVKRGDIVATYIPASKGESGMSVIGTTVGGVLGKEAEPIQSDDLMLSRDQLRYLSKKDGFLCSVDGKVKVMDYLVFDKDVNYTDGGITFDGNIQINGSVTDNINISSTGDIVITGFVGGAHLIAGKDIVIIGGVNGDEEGSIIAGGNIAAGFFENAKAEAGGDIEVGYSLNSEVHCDGVFTTKGKKSLICGGLVHANKGIQVGTIGSKTRTKTYVEVGSDEDDSEEYNLYIKERNAANDQIDKIHEIMDSLIAKIGALAARQHEQYIKLQNALDEFKKRRSEAEEKLQIFENKKLQKSSISIEVMRDIYENCTVCVNGNKLLIQEDKRGVKFSSQGRKVIVE